jgi:hypothetical protein
VLSRYVQVKARYRQVHSAARSLQPDELEYHIGRGCPAFDGIVVNADASPPLIDDGWDHDFLDTVVKEHGAIPEPDPEGPEQARRFVFYAEGSSPSKPEPVPNVIIWPTGRKNSNEGVRLIGGS